MKLGTAHVGETDTDNQRATAAATEIDSDEETGYGFNDEEPAEPATTK